MPYMKTKDATCLYYKDWGSGKPVVFVSGWGLSAEMWNYQMIDLTARGLRCIAYDRRGHGRSDDPGRGYHYDTLADDLASLIDHLNLQDVMLVAHSMGSGEIVRYLTRYGSEKVKQCVFIGTTLPFPLKSEDNPSGFDRSLIDINRAMWKKDFPRWLQVNAAPYFGDGLPGCEVSPEMTDWTKSDMLQTSLKAILDCNLTLIETDFREELHDIAVPTLFIHGDSDRSLPVEMSGKIAAQLVPNARFHLYENAPHGLYITHMERVNNDLILFIS
ncbi:alpha/beta fold hydrolase [Paenibacillus aestuarii]|uniref:Alpha/beta fold hydrolase n=1 Tax=Paenibacillus aestuarii TaxID=516965 RepID=A0ABW0KEC1_9BACL|nr:alpha/beta hydrolase [Paenibacillus aestuarii]